MNIILMGYMGSGKSTVGLKLATILSYKYLDLDDYIEEKEDLTISELFKTKGEIYFRKVESRYLQEVLNLEFDQVISLGGGTPCYGINMTQILTSQDSKSIYLKTSIPQLVKRLSVERDKRPLIAHLKTDEQLREFIGKHLFERSVFYNQSDLTILTDEKSAIDIVEEIVLELF